MVRGNLGQGQGTAGAAVKPVEKGREGGAGGGVAGGGLEERGAGAQLERVHGAHDVLGRGAAMGEDGLCRLDQPGAQNGVGEIGAGLGQIAQAVVDGARAAAKAGQLREDPPDPMAALAPRPQFRKGGGVVTGLGGVEAVGHG